MLGIIFIRKVFQNEVIQFLEFRELLCIVRCIQINEYLKKKKMIMSAMLRGLFGGKK